MFKRLFPMMLVVSFLSIPINQTRLLAGINWQFFNDLESTAFFSLVGSSLVVSLVSRSNKKKSNEHEKEIVKYMKSNHASLKRDFSLASGDTIREIGYQLKFDEHETNLLKNNIEGSEQQQQILQTLSGEITVEKARAFAANLSTLVRDSVEPYRYVDLIQFAMLPGREPTS